MNMTAAPYQPLYLITGLAENENEASKKRKLGPLEEESALEVKYPLLVH
jgi:hypothetical protein